MLRIFFFFIHIKRNIFANELHPSVFFIAYVGKLAHLFKDKLGSLWFPACTFWIIFIQTII